MQRRFSDRPATSLPLQPPAHLTCTNQPAQIHQPARPNNFSQPIPALLIDRTLITQSASPNVVNQQHSTSSTSPSQLHQPILSSSITQPIQVSPTNSPRLHLLPRTAAPTTPPKLYQPADTNFTNQFAPATASSST